MAVSRGKVTQNVVTMSRQRSFPKSAGVGQFLELLEFGGISLNETDLYQATLLPLFLNL